jgi:hypothetical protein
MSTYAYPLLGGTMLASSVYHLLYFNGQILGISGIYGGAISDIVQAVRKSFASAQSPPQEANGTTVASEASPLVEQSDENKDLRWRVSFVAGLLAGGTLLRLLRAPIESRLGSPIFEQAVVQGTSATPLASLLVGLLVGVGTNVIVGFDPYTNCQVIWGMYLGSHVVRTVEALFAFGRGNSKLLPDRSRNRAIPESAHFESLRLEYPFRSDLGHSTSTSCPPLPLHCTSNYPQQVLPIGLVLLHRRPLCLCTCIGWYAPTIENSRIPFSSFQSALRSCPLLCRHRSSRAIDPGLAAQTSIDREAAIQRQIQFTFGNGH